MAATGLCARCGRFGCAGCLKKNLAELWCLECHARPQARLSPSDRSKTALMLGLFGFHGVLILLPIAFWLARKELTAIERGESVPASRPYAQGAIALSGAGLVIWLGALVWWLSRFS